MWKGDSFGVMMETNGTMVEFSKEKNGGETNKAPNIQTCSKTKKNLGIPTSEIAKAVDIHEKIIACDLEIAKILKCL